MNLTICTFGIGSLSCLKIGNPIFNVAGPSKRYDNSFESGRITCKSLKIASWVVKSSDILKRILIASRTIPGADGSDRLVGNAGHVGHLECKFGAVRRIAAGNDSDEQNCS